MLIIGLISEEIEKSRVPSVERRSSVDYLQNLTDRERNLLKESFENIDTAAEKNGVIMFLQSVFTSLELLKKSMFDSFQNVPRLSGLQATLSQV